MNVTIKDVAKRADVAPSTVSRVMSGTGRISEATKKRVLKAIKDLNYKPNSIARKLASKKSKILGIVIPRDAGLYFNNPFFIEAMRGIGTIAEENTYYIMYAFAKDENDELKNIKEFSSNHLIDGICLLTVRDNDKCIEYLKKINFPFVVIGSPDNSDNILWVDNDNFKATFDVTTKLIKKDYKKIAYIGGNKHLKVSKNRLNGYLASLKENNITIDKNLIFEEKKFSESCGFNAMSKILKKTTPDIVLTSEDLLAVGANRYLKENNFNNIKVIGFNNTPIAQYQNPPISSIDINAYKLGYNAGNLLISSLNNNDLSNNFKIVETKFIER